MNLQLKDKKLAFVVVSCNSSKFLAECLECLEQAKTVCSKQIVVIDNASVDGSLAIAGTCDRAKLFALEENIGFGAANNLACRSVAADYYFLVNPDVRLDGALDLDRIIAVLEKCRDVAICGTRLCFPDGTSQTSSFTHTTACKMLVQSVPGYRLLARFVSRSRGMLHLLSLAGRQPASYAMNHAGYAADYGIREVEWVSGASMIIRGKYIREHGLFDEKIFLYGEDEDLCINAKNSGWRVVLMNTDPISHVHGWHSGNRKSREILDMKYRSLVYFTKKHHADTFAGSIMRILLPVYVYGIRGWYIRASGQVSKTC